jgi:hypothetical protein
MKKTLTLDLTSEEIDLIYRYGLLRGVKGALSDPEEYEVECVNALMIFDTIQHKLRTALRSDQ